MPYHGPSGGCITCLSRKIKCDETKPTCNKCAKSKRSCGGYRAMVDLIFRDNTESTKARVGRRELMVIEDSPIIKTACNWPNISAFEASLQPQSIDDQALACFFTDWAWAPKPYTFSLDFLPREYSRVNPERRNCCMTAATRAVSLAHLAHKSRDPKIRQLADTEYVSALSSTNQALSISAEAMQDETMMAVHLLILFENIITSAGGRSPSLLPWITHLGGATQLVLERGPGQLNRDVGAAMFQIQMFKMIVYGMINGQAIPTLFEGAWKETGDHGDAAVQIMKLVSSCPALLERAKVLLGCDVLQGEDYFGDARWYMKENFSKLAGLVADIADTDETLKKWTKASIDSRSWIANNWSFFLAAHVVVNRLLEICLGHFSMWSSSLFSDPDDDFNPFSPTFSDSIPDLASFFDGLLLRRAQDAQKLLVDQICGLIPQALQLSSRYPDEPVASSGSPLVSYLMLWPLHVALHATSISVGKREWVKSILRFIAVHDGLQMADILVHEPYGLLDRLASLERYG